MATNQIAARVGSATKVIAAVMTAVAAVVAAYFAYRTYNIQKPAPSSAAAFQEPKTLAGASCSTRVSRAGVQVGGRASMVGHDRAWMLLQSPDVGRFYIPVPTSLVIGADGNWSLFIPYIGVDDDKGRQFSLIVIAANLDADNFLSRTANTPRRDGDTPFLLALPVGVRVLAQGCVTRL